jgi:hypothetical protein
MSLSYDRIRQGPVIGVRIYSYTLGDYIIILVPYYNLTYAQAIEKLIAGSGGELTPEYLHFEISDEEFNLISDAPSFDGDNSCHHISVKGNLSLVDTTVTPTDCGLQDAGQDKYGNQYVALVGESGYRGLKTPERKTSGTTSSHAQISGFSLNYEGKSDWYYRGKYWYSTTSVMSYQAGILVEEIYDELTGRTSVYKQKIKTGMCRALGYTPPPGFDTRYLQKQYHTMVNYYFRSLELIKVKGNQEFLASQEAALSYQAYDINMVENLISFNGLEDLLPKRSADDIVRLLENSRFTTLPSKILDVAKSLADTYLWNKYVFQTTASDLTSLTVGDLASEPEEINHSLQMLAEQLVYKGSKEVTRYGHSSYTEISPRIGSVEIRTNARLRAYPKYLKDMSDAAIIVENIGLALSAERLVQVLPYEFAAEWFLPIEESIRSIEYNDARLNSMWEIKGLCLSTKKTVSLGDLKANFGFTKFSGDLVFTDYGRHTEINFPSTRLPSIGPADINSSRVLQGSALIITK